MSAISQNCQRTRFPAKLLVKQAVLQSISPDQLRKNVNNPLTRSVRNAPCGQVQLLDTTQWTLFTRAPFQKTLRVGLVAPQKTSGSMQCGLKFSPKGHVDRSSRCRFLCQTLTSNFLIFSGFQQPLVFLCRRMFQNGGWMDRTCQELRLLSSNFSPRWYILGHSINSHLEISVLQLKFNIHYSRSCLVCHSQTQQSLPFCWFSGILMVCTVLFRILWVRWVYQGWSK